MRNFSYYIIIIVKLHLAKNQKHIKMKKYFKTLVLLLIVISINLGCENKQQKKNQAGETSIKQGNLGEVIEISPSEFKEKSINHTIIDIRTPYEFKQGYIEGAININLYDREFLEKFESYDKNEPIFLYCRSGNRTSSAAKKLIKAGFMQVYDLQGGILNWEKNKNKIKK